MTSTRAPDERWVAQPVWFKLGHIVPHQRSDVTPYQFYRVAPPGVMLVTVPFDLRDYTASAVEHELSGLWNRVDSLVERDVDRVVLAGVPVAAALGRRRVAELVDSIAQRSGRPADTDLESHVRAAHHLGVATVAMATRWAADLNESLASYLASAGIEVVSTASHPRGLAQNKASDPNDDHDLMISLARQAVTDASSIPDALFLPGGLGLVVDASPMLEAEFGIPVLTNVTSTLWAALHEHGVGVDRPPAYPSRLLATLPQRRDRPTDERHKEEP
jgi:maleate cis-trans isomerase